MPNSLQYPPDRQRDLQLKWGQPLLLTVASTCAPMNTQVDADGAGLLDALVDTRPSQDLNDNRLRDHGEVDDEDQDDDDGDDDEEEDDGDDDEDEDNGDDDEEDDGDDDNDDGDDDEDEDEEDGDDDEEEDEDE